jgi:hypothetical protein
VQVCSPKPDIREDYSVYVTSRFETVAKVRGGQVLSLADTFSNEEF